MSIDPTAFRGGYSEPERRIVYPKQKHYNNGCGVTGSGNTAFYDIHKAIHARAALISFPWTCQVAP